LGAGYLTDLILTTSGSTARVLMMSMVKRSEQIEAAVEEMMVPGSTQAVGGETGVYFLADIMTAPVGGDATTDNFLPRNLLKR
jgi:hypothetical protein